MELGLNGKVVGVTGSAGGIGKSIAERFAAEGCRVMICDVNEGLLRQTEREFLEKGCEVYAAKVDVTKADEVKAFIEEGCRRFGPLGVWVNNAGIYPQKQLTDMTPDEWDRLFGINVKSVFLCTCAAAQRMKQSGGGVIINAASFAALVPSAGSGGYAATKAAVLSMTRTFAAELAPHGIRVNAYIPGVIATDMTREVIQSKRDSLLGQIALHRLGAPEDVANAVVFLASEAAAYITGTYLEVSGGKLCVQNPDSCWAGQASAVEMERKT